MMTRIGREQWNSLKKVHGIGVTKPSQTHGVFVCNFNTSDEIQYDMFYCCFFLFADLDC